MTNAISGLALETLRDLGEFKKSGSKEGFRMQLQEELMCRSAADPPHVGLNCNCSKGHSQYFF
jgi:hypothetical protein